MKRKFYRTLLEWKENYVETPLMVVGARQIGKTYLINEFCKNEFENYIYINLVESPNIINIFEEKISFSKKIQKLELELEKTIDIEKTIIFFDEIQESEEIITSLKFFSENTYKIICAGSLLGVKLNRFHSSFPVGKVRIELMNSMDFEEFLMALSKDMWIEEIKKCYQKNNATSIHEQLLELYRTYLCVGGMPESINEFKRVDENILRWDNRVLKNIAISYLADMNKYTLNNKESIKNEKVYKTIPSILAKENKKFKYSEIEKGAEKRNYESSIDWLVSSNMVYKCNLVNNVETPLKAYSQENMFKLYLNDVSLLTMLLEIGCPDIILNKPFMYKGTIAENYVAQALFSNSLGLYYWTSSSSAEIDFLIDTDDGVIPIEVKSGDNIRSQSLEMFMKKYKSKYAIRLSSRNFGFFNNIKSVPLYACFCIEGKKRIFN